MSSKNSKIGNRVKMSSSERKRSKLLRQSNSPLRERYLEGADNRHCARGMCSQEY